MPHLFSFSTHRFDISMEPENDINPIPGHGVLNWIRGSLPQAYVTTEPQTEDFCHGGIEFSDSAPGPRRPAAELGRYAPRVVVSSLGCSSRKDC